MNRLAYILLFILISMPCVFAIEDNFVNSSLAQKDIAPPIVQEEYNYQDTTRIPVKLSILNEIKSEKDIQEGQILEFKVVENVIYHREKLVSKGSLATARVETIIDNGMNGIPASIILGDFKVGNLKSSRLSTDYEKYGMDFSLLVFPLKWALTPLPPTGSLTNFIKGGHVRIKERDTITIFYHPNWL